jgi:ATP-dependent RNA helicase DeaD
MHRQAELPKAFEELGVAVSILKALRKIGYEKPSDIQKELIPRILSGRDILGQARTGTGKTAAFGIPALQLMDKALPLQALCLAPTRELAVQVTGELRRLAEFTGLRCVAVYGGQKIQRQVHELGRKPHFVVGTPGRVMDMMGRGYLDISAIKMIILDEVDRMLDIGFRDDIRRILGTIKSEHQTVFVSATLDGEIRTLARKYTKDPDEVNVSRDQITVGEVSQYFVTAERHDKDRLLKILLEHDKPDSTIVFTNTKHAARKLTQKLFNWGIDAVEIHGDLMQRKRDSVMERFRKHRIKVLVATDLASRGIDVHNVTHIINYDLPADVQVYVHRIGRTARMGAQGKAVSFVTREEGKLLTEIEMLINKQIEECTFPGFTVSPPERKRGPAAPPPPRTGQPVAVAVGDHIAGDHAAGDHAAGEPAAGDAGTPDEAPARPTHRPLGGRFKPSRRRR